MHPRVFPQVIQQQPGGLFLRESPALVFPTEAEVDAKPEELYFMPEQPASPEQICREGLLVLSYILSLSDVASRVL